MSNQCIDSFDCTTSSGVKKFCFEEASFSDEVFFCDCSIFFGWSGEECDQPSSVQTVYKTLSSIIIFWSFLLIILSTRTFILNICLQYNPKQGIDPIVYTGVFVVLSSVCICTAASLYLPSYFLSDFFVIQTYGNIPEEEIVVEARTGYIAHVFTVFAAAFQSFSALFMILSLDKTISKISRFDPILQNKKRKLKNNIFFLICCILVVVMIILSATNYVVTGTVVIVIFTFVTSGYFLYSAVKFVKAMKTLSATENEIVRVTTQLVTRTCLQISFALILACLLGVAYFVADLGKEERLAPGDFNYALVLKNSVELIGLYLLTVTAWYVNSVTEGPVLADQWSHLCCVFGIWDRKNKQLMPADTDILNTQHTSKQNTTQIS